MSDSDFMAPLGATVHPDGGCQFVVWAPAAQNLSVHVVAPVNQIVAMDRWANGYFHVTIANLGNRARYFYRFDDGRERPDPASKFQPDGVHGPSQVIDVDDFPWTDNIWSGQELQASVFYELHVGTYTPAGTFDAVIPHCDELRELGITTIELMPVAQFPGARNWGYDGVQPWAPQNSYGGPRGLQTLVNAAHQQGLAVTLDVVYNHLGPEGNYFSEYGPYFTDKYQTPWGRAINYDGPDSDHVRHFFIQNALYWLEKYHIDALRLDAVHGIYDFGARHFLAELQDAVSALENRIGRKLHLIAESDLNDSRLLRSVAEGGYGLSAQWSDDYHHSVHSLLTGERSGYYSDFGDVHHLGETLRRGWFYSGQYSAFRLRKHGNSPSGLSRSSFVVCSQNHDQIGNRAKGERLSTLLSFEGLKLAAAVTTLSPFVPLLFMGEEYGETAPFQYFTSHSDADLIAAVRKGRREEFAAFAWEGEIPDPDAHSSFLDSVLNHDLKTKEPHRTLLALYSELLKIRREYSLSGASAVEILENGNTITASFGGNSSKTLLVVFAFGPAADEINSRLPSGTWTVRLDSADPRWRGPGSSLPKDLPSVQFLNLKLAAQSFVVLERLNPSAE
jgi:maltooligosyltrehalose trehalohydrolase